MSKMDKLVQLRKEKGQLIDYIKKLIDYCMCMQTATGYKPANSPNLLMIIKEVNKMEDKS